MHLPDVLSAELVSTVTCYGRTDKTHTIYEGSVYVVSDLIPNAWMGWISPKYMLSSCLWHLVLSSLLSCRLRLRFRLLVRR